MKPMTKDHNTIDKHEVTAPLCDKVEMIDRWPVFVKRSLKGRFAQDDISENDRKGKRALTAAVQQRGLQRGEGRENGEDATEGTWKEGTILGGQREEFRQFGINPAPHRVIEKAREEDDDEDSFYYQIEGENAEERVKLQRNIASSQAPPAPPSLDIQYFEFKMRHQPLTCSSVYYYQNGDFDDINLNDDEANGFQNYYSEDDSMGGDSAPEADISSSAAGAKESKERGEAPAADTEYEMRGFQRIQCVVGGVIQP